MVYKIIWSRFSEQKIDEIYDYYKNRVNSRLAKKIVKTILSAPDKITKYPRLGAKEPLLGKRKIEYRYLLAKNYKIIYSINEDDKTIRIADVFDTRQNPIKIEDSIK